MTDKSKTKATLEPIADSDLGDVKGGATKSSAVSPKVKNGRSESIVINHEEQDALKRPGKITAPEGHV